MLTQTQSKVRSHRFADPGDPSVDDRDLLTLLQSGSDSAFAILSQRYERRLFRIAMGFVRNEADAEDIVQESLLRAFTSIATFRGESGVYTWLVRIVMNTSLMLLRKRSRRVMVSLDNGIQQDEPWVHSLRQPGEDAEAEAIRREQTVLLREATRQLPARYKALLTEWLSGNVTTAELASKSALSVPATKSRLLRGRHHIEVVLRSRLQATRPSLR